MSVSQLDRRLAELLKTRRQDKGLSIRFLAEQAGLVPSTISRIESGDQKPSLMIVLQLCKYLDISAADLVAHLRGQHIEVPQATDTPPSQRLKMDTRLNAAQVELLIRVATRLQQK